jgi:hypothetical protein
MKRRGISWAAACASIMLIAACTTAPEPTPLPPVPPVVVVPPPPAPVVEAAPSLPELMARSRKAIATRPLNAATKCSFRDHTGYRGTLNLAVKNAEVSRFEAEVTIPKRGICRFALKDFAQAEKLPNVRLARRDGTCSVRMWEQGARTTIAFSECAAQCSGEAFDYLWPILVDTKRGRCS